ncbi:MAG: protein serine phosphatase with sensor(S) [Naasia sp.]|nr:protein serine phosphatase with sensor(S) [Naasia sp.]
MLTGIDGTKALTPVHHDAVAELARQRALDELKVLGTGPVERFDRITRMAARLLGFEHVAINFLDHDRQWTASRTSDAVYAERREDSYCDVAIQQTGTLVVPDALLDARFRDNPLLETPAGMRFYAGHPIASPNGERVGAICVSDTVPRPFGAEQQTILRDIATWVQDELALTREFAASAEVQQGLLPKTLATVEGYEAAGVCRPVHAVSGDFYDWYPVRGGAAFTLADAMGKGVPAALISATVRATMRAGSRYDGVAAAVESAADALEADLEGAATFVTLFHAHLKQDTGMLSYVDAGHGLTLVVRADGTSQRLASTGLPLGVGWDAAWDEEEVELRHGDVLVSVSDGVLDALDGTLESLVMVERAVRGAAPKAAAIVEAVAGLAGPTAPDDLTVLVLRRLPGVPLGG